MTVYLPQYIVGHWWEKLLHNRRARRMANTLMLVHGVTITLVPWLLDSSELIYGRRSRPLPGQRRARAPGRGVWAPLASRGGAVGHGVAPSGTRRQRDQYGRARAASS